MDCVLSWMKGKIENLFLETKGKDGARMMSVKSKKKQDEGQSGGYLRSDESTIGKDTFHMTEKESTGKQKKEGKDGKESKVKKSSDKTEKSDKGGGKTTKVVKANEIHKMPEKPVGILKKKCPTHIMKMPKESAEKMHKQLLKRLEKQSEKRDRAYTCKMRVMQRVDVLEKRKAEEMSKFDKKIVSETELADGYNESIREHSRSCQGTKVKIQQYCQKLELTPPFPLKTDGSDAGSSDGDSSDEETKMDDATDAMAVEA